MSECTCGVDQPWQDDQGRRWVCTPDDGNPRKCHWDPQNPNNPFGASSLSAMAQPMVLSKKRKTQKVGPGDQVLIPQLRYVGVVGEELGDDHVRVHYSEIAHHSKVFHRDELHLIEKPKGAGEPRKQAKKQE